MRFLVWLATALAGALIVTSPALAAKPKPRYYLALGDSLSVGVQPGPAAHPGQEATLANTRQGYADQLFERLRRTTPGLRLVKAGCGGATTGSFMNGGPGVDDVPGCTPPRRLPYGDTSPSTSQLAYAERFLRRHGARVAYVTIDIGPNDLDSCATGGGIDLACVTQGTQAIATDLPQIARRLKAAASPRTRIAGATLYNPYVAKWLDGPAEQAVAAASQELAENINRTAIIPAFRTYGIAVARVDRAMRSDVPLTQTTTLPGGGTAPVAVVAICAWTWMCTPPPVGPNIHANAAGYGRMASAFATALRSRG